ncbi:MAG: hypothetical protein CMD92_01035 [Gammaproteobacteria bacterium]|nr:hypothetical protein [Gammaproteobacteria bacterium]HBW84131.1 hypothetical protein [Gammaproteobacteria bacterium]
MDLIAESEMNVTSVIPMEGGSTLVSEGNVGKYGKVFASHNLYSNSSVKNAGNFDGEARALMEDGTAVGASLQGVWKRDGAKITINSLDDASNGDQNYAVIEVDMIEMKSKVKVYAI